MPRCAVQVLDQYDEGMMQWRAFAPVLLDRVILRQFAKPRNAPGRSEAFRAAHRRAGEHKPLYLDHPQFEGFEVCQTVARTSVTAAK
jgi:hypothetical protein